MQKKGSGKKGKVEIASATVEKTTISPPKDHRSYADSGATAHCIHTIDAFVPGSLKPCPNVSVLLANKSSVEAGQCGEVILPFENENLLLKRVLYIPNLGYNLVSTGNRTDNGIESTFGRTDVKLILEENRFFVGSGDRDQDSRMYMLPQPISQATLLLAMSLTESETTDLWNRRLAHINTRALPKLHEHVLDVPKLRELKDFCRAC